MGVVAIDPGFFRLSAAYVRAAEGRRAHRDVLGYMHQTSERNLRVRTPVIDVVSYMQRRNDLKIAQAEVIYSAFRDGGSGLTSAELWLANDKANRRKKDGAYKRNAGRLPRLGVFLTASFPYGVTRATAVAALEHFLDYLEAEIGCAAEAVIHDKNGPDHCHILITDRVVDEHGVGTKIRDLNGVAAKAEGQAILDGDKMLAPAIEGMRSQWAVLMREIAPEGTRTIDHRSFARRGIDLEPVTTESHASIREQKAEGDEYWLERRTRELSARKTAMVDDTRTSSASGLECAPAIAPPAISGEVETLDTPWTQLARTKASRAPLDPRERTPGRLSHGGTARRSAPSKDRLSQRSGARQRYAAAAVLAFTAHRRRQTNPLLPELARGDAARSAGKTADARQSRSTASPTPGSAASNEHASRTTQARATLRPVDSRKRTKAKSGTGPREASAAVLAMTVRKQRHADQALPNSARRDSAQSTNSPAEPRSIVPPTSPETGSTKPSSMEPFSKAASAMSDSIISGEGRNPFANPRRTGKPAIPATIIGGLVDVASRPSKASAAALLSFALKSVKPGKTLEAVAAVLPLIGIGLRSRRRRSETQSVLGICALLARKHLETARAAIAGLAPAVSKPDAAVPNHTASPDMPGRPISSDRTNVDAGKNDIGSNEGLRRGSSPASGIGMIPTLKPPATTPVDDVAHGPTRRPTGAGLQVSLGATQKLALEVVQAGPVEARLDNILGRNSRSGSRYDATRPAYAPYNTGKSVRGPDENGAKAPEPTERETIRHQKPIASVTTSTAAPGPELGRPMTSRASSHPANRDKKSSRPSESTSVRPTGSGDIQSRLPSAQTARSGRRSAPPSREKLALLYAAVLYKDRRWRRERPAELATAFGIDVESWDRRIEAEYRRLFVETDISAAEVKKLTKAEATSAGAADLIRMFDSWDEHNRDNRARRGRRAARNGSNTIDKGAVSTNDLANGVEGDITDKR